MADMDIGQTPKAIPMTYCVCARHVDSSGSLWLDACACVCVRSCRYLSVRHQKRQKLNREKKTTTERMDEFIRFGEEIECKYSKLWLIFWWLILMPVFPWQPLLLAAADIVVLAHDTRVTMCVLCVNSKIFVYAFWTCCCGWTVAMAAVTLSTPLCHIGDDNEGGGK